MPRHELLEAILRARYELQHAEPSERTRCLAELHQRLDEARAGTHLGRTELLRMLEDRYREYARAQREAEARRRSV